MVIGQYFYDGDGKRVKKIVPDSGESTIFVYDAAGRQIAEYSTNVLPVEDAKVAYLTNDHLGSPRINTDRDGNVTSRHDYHPFGQEITIHPTNQGRLPGLGYAPDSVRKQFTGYERDDETELDYAKARMHNYNHGRFTSPDPYNPIVRQESSYAISLYAAQPQNWNKYAYCFNNPYHYVDRDGETPTIVTGVIGAVVGAVVGAGLETARQAILEDKFDGSKIGGAAVQGAVFGGVAGLTAGGSLAVQVAALAIANGAGGIANRAISNDSNNPPISGTSIVIDTLAGGAGAYVAPLGTTSYLGATNASRNAAAAEVETLLISSPVPGMLPTLTRPVVQNTIRDEVYHGYGQNVARSAVRAGSKTATSGFLSFLFNTDIARPVQSAPKTPAPAPDATDLKINDCGGGPGVTCRILPDK